MAEGIESFKRGIAMKPDDADAHGELAKAYQFLGMTQEAAEQWRETLKLRPRHPTGLKEVGAMFVQVHDLPMPSSSWLRQRPRRPNIEVKRVKALAHALLRQLPAAMAESRAILVLDADNVGA